MINSKYEEYLKYELNYSDLTINNYIDHINKYLDYMKKRNINYLKVNKDNILSFLKYLDAKGLSNRSISNILSAIRNYYDFLLDQKLIDFNLFKTISNPKLEKKLPNFLSYEQMRSILDSLDNKTVLDKRNKLIVEILYATGIRVSELVNLKLEDINKEDKSIRIMGKGKKERIVYYGDYAMIAMEDYLQNRNSNSEYLILNSKGNKITTRSIEKIISKISVDAEIKNNVTPHTFRHTFATHLLNNGADIKSVQELLGHESLNTTEVYTHITSDYLKEVYLKNMPRK